MSSGSNPHVVQQWRASPRATESRLRRQQREVSRRAGQQAAADVELEELGPGGRSHGLVNPDGRASWLADHEHRARASLRSGARPNLARLGSRFRMSIEDDGDDDDDLVFAVGSEEEGKGDDSEFLKKVGSRRIRALNLAFRHGEHCQKREPLGEAKGVL